LANLYSIRWVGIRPDPQKDLTKHGGRLDPIGTVTIEIAEKVSESFASRDANTDQASEAIRRTAPHQIWKINHLVTLRSRNADDSKNEMTVSAPAPRPKYDAFSTNITFCLFARLTARVTAVLRGAKQCSERTT
jgi:hypothetical protein